MTTSRGVTIMKKVISGTAFGHDKRAFTYLIAFFHSQTRTLKNRVDDFRRVKRIDSCEIRRLRLQMVPTFGRRRVDVVDDGIPAGFQRSAEVARVEANNTGVQLHQ